MSRELTIDLFRAAGVGLWGLVAINVGALVGLRYQLSSWQRSAVRHIAAGTVFAGLIVDVFFRLLSYRQAVFLGAGGLVVGTLALLGVRAFSDRQSGKLSLALTTVIDVLVDGLLMGQSMATGQLTAIVFAVALAPEFVLLGITLVEELAALGLARGWRTVVPLVTGAGILACAFAGIFIQRGAPQAAVFVYGFGAAAIAYFVMEELLREAHEEVASVELAALFFVGFLPLFIAGMAVRAV